MNDSDMQPERRRQTVLLIDDDQQILEALSQILLHHGFRAITAANGVEGIARAESDSPDIIILDIKMSGVDGITVCEILKRGEGTRNIPVVMLTTQDDIETKLRALTVGANEFLAKPVAAPELILRIRNLLELSDLEEVRRLNAELQTALTNLEQSQTMVIQQEKLASIGQLAAGIFHEINTPLSFVYSNIGRLGSYCERLISFVAEQKELLRRAAPPEQLAELAAREKRQKISAIIQDAGALVAESLEGMERINGIVNDLKYFVRGGEQKKLPADLNDEIRRILNIVKNEVKYKATIKLELEENLPPVACVPEQIGQVIMNLIVNAAHAINEHGEITIKSWATAGKVSISVSDTGRGIPADIQKHIFEPFFTTKEPGKGTGLGLSISAEIIHRHNGELRVSSEVGKGTTFTIVLPIS